MIINVKSKYIRVISIAIACLPIIYYFTIFFTYQVNAPHEDDYDTVLGFLNKLVQMDSVFDKLWLAITQMSNEHIIFFNFIITWVQYSLYGSINFKILTTIGSTIVLITWIIVIKRTLGIVTKNTSKKHEVVIWGLYLILSSLLFFNLSYYDSSFRATSLMQKIGVVLVAFLAIDYFTKQKTVCALLFALSGILINGNGLFIPASILLISLLDKEKRSIKNISLWLIATIIVFSFYKYIASISPRSYDYVQITNASSILGMFNHYFNFCGSILHPFKNFIPLITGIVTNALFVFILIWKREKKSYLLYGVIIFLILSFLATSYGRAESGYYQAFSSRYKLYAATFLLFNFALYLSLIKKEGKVLLSSILTLIIFVTITKYHSRHLKTVIKRSADLEYSINNFSFSPSDSIRLQYAPNQDLPREVLKNSARLGIYSNAHIDKLLGITDEGQ